MSLNSPDALMGTADAALAACALLERLRTRAPRVHCITNTVAQAFTANVLLAAGGVPSMTLAADEIGSFVAGADSVLVNLGTLDVERRAAIDAALAVARSAGKRWVLDPVFVDRAPNRRAFACALLERAPAAVRLNADEFAALDARGSAIAGAAQRWATVVALTGAGDEVSDGARTATVLNGDPLMARITAMGCAGSAMVAAACAVEPDVWRATVSALALFGIAGELAARASRGPGTFAAAFLDALHGVTPEQIDALARVSP